MKNISCNFPQKKKNILHFFSYKNKINYVFFRNRYMYTTGQGFFAAASMTTKLFAGLIEHLTVCVQLSGQRWWITVVGSCFSDGIALYILYLYMLYTTELLARNRERERERVFWRSIQEMYISVRVFFSFYLFFPPFDCNYCSTHIPDSNTVRSTQTKQSSMCQAINFCSHLETTDQHSKQLFYCCGKKD